LPFGTWWLKQDEDGTVYEEWGSGRAIDGELADAKDESPPSETPSLEWCVVARCRYAVSRAMKLRNGPSMRKHPRP
jgi:hypothetical protein